MKELFKTPENVQYRLSKEDMEKLVADHLFKVTGKDVELVVGLDEKYIDLYDLYPCESNDDDVLESLKEKGYNLEDPLFFRMKVVQEIFGPISVNTYAYMTSEDKTEFDILVNISYQHFLNNQNLASISI